MPSVDTIAAIATAPGLAGVGVVRVSGPSAGAIGEVLLGRPPRPRYAHYAGFHRADGELLDRGILLYFPGVASYTGEPVLELQGHGNPLLLDQVLQRCCQLGARLARPGEFTERAFLNGKLDLAQAEAVADLIAARSHHAVRAALRTLEGAFSDQVQATFRQLVEARVHIEAAIDFPEEEIDFLADPAIAARLHTLREQLQQLLVTSRRGRRLSDSGRVALIGRPNQGKSSLLNALAGTDRAIVTATAGTTRDVLRESISLDGYTLELADTAGLHDSDDLIEREGIARAERERAVADIVVLVTEAGDAEADQQLFEGTDAAAARIVVVNKIDLTGQDARLDDINGVTWVWLSARRGDGLEALQQTLKRLVSDQLGEGDYSARRRHVRALEQVLGHVEAAEAMVLIERSGELAAEELRAAQQALGEITGEYHSDDLLGAIFGSFCIGK
ncbi:tRNA uridine-5-carboxymethylaminomethyl(34) synthesis GTPase MnmE [Frateuria aurantia]